MNEDYPTSVFRKSKAGEYATTIPRETVERAGISNQDRVAIIPRCTEGSLVLELEMNPGYQGANVVSVKMQGPRNRQAVLRPPRRFCAVLRLEDVTVAWDGSSTPLRAELNREPLLNPGYLGAFENATATSVTRRSSGTYSATLPTRKVQAVGFSKSDLIRVWFDCLRGVSLFLLSTGDPDVDGLDQFRLQMAGPESGQPRVTVTRPLGDALELAGRQIEWVANPSHDRLLGRLG